MRPLREMLQVLDRAHVPPAGSVALDRFKEWYHFNIIDMASATDIILNVSCNGDIGRAGAGRVEVILLCYRPALGWVGDIDTFEGTAAQLSNQAMTLLVGDVVRLRCERGTYYLDVRSRDGSIELQAQFTAQSEPLLIWNDTPLGHGSVNWLIAPCMSVQGTLRIGAEVIRFQEAGGYHDHNWGYWRWGEDFAWDWGFAAQAQRGAAGRYTLVFDRTSDRLGATSLENTLALWRDAELEKVFARQMLRCERRGRFSGPVAVRPGAARLIAPGAVQTVPRKFCVSARDGADWLDVEYLPDAALQVSIPNEFGFGLVGLNETFGPLHVHGQVKGESVEFSTRAAFEFLT